MFFNILCLSVNNSSSLSFRGNLMAEFKCVNTTSPNIKENIEINSPDKYIESFDNASIKGITVTKKELSTFQEKSKTPF